MKDMKKYVPAIILACFLLTAVMLWLVRNQADKQVRQSDKSQAHHTLSESGNQGLIIRFHQDHSPKNDSRLSRLLALYIPHDEPPTPFLEPGPFQALWEGWIDIEEEDTFTFHFEGTGELEMMVENERILQAGQTESEPVSLGEGKHFIRAEYASPDTGSSRIRLLWSTSSFGPESIPPTSLSHDESDEDLQLATRLRRGRLLIAEHSCLSCHMPEDPSYIDESLSMPELAMGAPDLTDVGSRLKAGWMKSWIKDPQAVHPSARMPGMNLNDQQAADIATYLATLGEPPPLHLPSTSYDIKKGGELFALQGCIACHTLDPEIVDRERLSLANIAEKWYPSALEDHLLVPTSHYKWTRMPDFRLSEEEAVAIVSFLFDQSDSFAGQMKVDGDPHRGKVLVQKQGCVSCHTAPVENQLEAPSLEALMQVEWDQVKMSEHFSDSGATPHPALDAEDREALQVFAQQGFNSLQRRSSIEFASRQIQLMNCQACHQIDGKGDKWSEHAGEVAHLLEEAETHPFGNNRPALTWVGEQLQPEWLENVLAGTLEHPARPWLDSRMPAVGAKPSMFARGLMAAHGYGTDFELIEPDPDLIRHGRALSVGIGYLGCDACHHGGEAGGMPAPHLNLLAERLRPEFYHWMLQSPRRIDPQTAMPEYVNPEGLTWQRERFDGDANKQFEAIWHYLVYNRANFELFGDERIERTRTPYDQMYQQMDKGPVYSGAIEVPGEGVRPKGLSIRVGEHRQATMHFDHDLLRMSAAWTGNFLEFHSDADWGIRGAPTAAGEIRFTSPEVTGWAGQNEPTFTDTREQPFGPVPEKQGQYKGLYLHGDRAVIAYSIYGTDVLESPWYLENSQTGAFVRDLQIGANDQALSVLLFDAEGEAETDIRGSMQVVRFDQNQRVKIAAIRAENGIELVVTEGQVALRLDPHTAGERSFRILIWEGDASQEEAFIALATESAEPENLDRFTEPGPNLWEPLVTRGELGESDGPYAVDVINSPLENPYDVMFHFTGVDFMDDGRAFLTTMHGDVWMVSGLDQSLEQVTWQRFASGLNMPFGVRIVDGKVYVSNEDELTILHDRSGNGEADYYENFRNLIAPGQGAWRQAFGLEVDAEGNFYFARGRGHRQLETSNGVFRISPDGKEIERIAVGFRQPWTMGISPAGRVTVTQQEGPWVPQTPVHKIDLETRKGNFYGDMNTYRVESYPRELGFEPPILWLPRHIDNSAGGQVWVNSDNWGLPRDQMLHLAWGRSTLMQLMHEQVDGDRQGGVVHLASFSNNRPRTGRFNPVDGQLYIAGFEDQGFQRVRYTGQNVNLPVAIHAHENGLRIRFSDPLNREAATDVASYTLHRWNYIWQEYYGSHHYSIKNPGRFGEDPVPVDSVTLSEDGKEIFLEISDMIPVMQMRIAYEIQAADGTQLQENIYNTIHALQPAFNLETMQAYREK